MIINVGSKSGGKRLGEVSLQRNSKHSLFTVVTAVYNGAARLESTLLSVLGQSYADVEYIVIDGGSTDGTLEVLRKYDSSIDYWVSEPDRGVYDAFNKACRLVSGSWTIFLGAGDVFYDTEVLTLIAEVVRDVGRETEIVYGKVCLTKSGNIPVDTLNCPWNQMYGRWKSGRPMLPHHQGVFHRDRLLSVEAPFDTIYKIAADSKLLYRSIQRAQPVFADVIVASASIGGVSTDVRHSMAAAKEVIRINRELGFTNYLHQLWFFSKAALKATINKLGGETVSRFCIDEYRRLTGRERLREDKSNGAVS
jgi:glycosyltransferase involved in cell wall biosynthesis